MSQAPSDSKLSDPRSVASYQSYGAARSAVSILTGEGVSANDLTIVGLDLQPEHGMTSWGKVILTGVLSGVMWGLLLAVLLWIFLPGHQLWLLVACGMGFGIIYGILAQVVQHAMTHPSPFDMKGTALATRFEVQAEADAADEARGVLGKPSPEKAEPAGPARRAAMDDASWLFKGTSKPVSPDKLPYLADQKTEVMKLSSMGDWFDATDEKPSAFFGDLDVETTTANMKPVDGRRELSHQRR